MKADDRLKLIYYRLNETTPSKGDRRRFQIVEAAIQLISESGVDQLSLERVAAVLGVDRPLVSYYFRKREDLLLEVFRYVVSVGQSITVQTLQAAKTDEDVIVQAVIAPLIWLGANPEHGAVMLLLYYYARVAPSFREFYQDVEAGGRKRFHAALGNLMPTKSASEIQDYANGFYSMALASFVQGAAIPTPSRLKALRLQATREARKYLRAILGK
jgi:AcrR family transcriptional regulator